MIFTNLFGLFGGAIFVSYIFLQMGSVSIEKKNREYGVSSTPRSNLEFNKSANVRMLCDVDCRRATMFAVYEVYMNIKHRENANCKSKTDFLDQFYFKCI